jgi:hypothetical protein
MADLISEQFGIVQMNSSELLAHIMDVRLRRRDRARPTVAKRVSKKKNPLSKMSDDQVRKLMEMTSE